MKTVYLATIAQLERMHRQFLGVVKAELDRLDIRDINNVQALILYNIGGDDMTVGELTLRGYYRGSNVSYNVKRMAEHGYLDQKRSAHDRRSVRVAFRRMASICLAISKRCSIAISRRYPTA